MAYDLEEQEQIDQLKAFWAKYGNLISWVLIAVLAGYAGWTYWNNTQTKHASLASGLYSTMESAIQAKDNTKAQTAAADIRKDYGDTVYAQFSALAAAKMAIDAKDVKEAKAQLQWVIDSKYNDEFATIARIRLSGILLDEKAYDDAMKLLPAEAPSKFQALVLDRKGDILAAQNKIEEARAMYKSALEKIDEKSPAHNLIELKLESVGGSSDKSAA
ncbi:MAG TPA: tetratricopeptide repeat protein [Burkholderiaceae bacterium]